jgi:hypothetical protein
MARESTKQGLLDQIRQERAEWQALLAEIGLERMEAPGLTDDWRFQDVVAHLTTWWRWEISRLEAARREEEPIPHPPQDQVQLINDWIYHTNRDRPLADVLADADAAWAQLEQSITTLPEPVLCEPGRFAWLKGEALGPGVLRGFFNHLTEEHEPAIRVWLQRTS